MSNVWSLQRLGGWWRLWVVVSIALGVPMWMVASEFTDVSDYAYDMDAQQARAWADAGKERVKVCDLSGAPTISAESNGSGAYSGSYFCTSDRQYLLAYIYALLPGAVLAVLGLTARWIYRGFRRSPPAR